MKIIRSNRKTMALEIRNGQLIVRAPHGISETEIQKFIQSHQKWIDRHLENARQAQKKAEDAGRLSMDEIHALADEALKVIPERVRFFADKMHVKYGTITIRNQRTKWGSCSGKGNLNFNCLLMLAPPEVIDAVIVHELCHLKEMNHSKQFYNEILKVYPDYHQWNQWLKDHGGELMARMTG